MFTELRIYVGRVREFDRKDWLVYVSWVGLMVGLVLATGGFVAVGHWGGVGLPAEAYLVPVGAAVFTLAIAIDTIGHRTVYKEEIRAAEGLGPFVIPALVLTLLSFLYSLIDEAFHWRRYVSQRSDRVEMWSHVGIFVGHLTMMIAWWVWYRDGYRGVAETVSLLSGHG
jgi:hypothetical protein